MSVATSKIDPGTLPSPRAPDAIDSEVGIQRPPWAQQVRTSWQHCQNAQQVTVFVDLIRFQRGEKWTPPSSETGVKKVSIRLMAYLAVTRAGHVAQ